MNLDIYWSLGFIGGAAVAGILLKAWNFDLHALIYTAIILAAGVGGGWLSDTYSKKR